MPKSLKTELSALGQIVLVFQGGGALGAYQIGVYQALHEAGIEPDWVIGTSIGAINAALIAGNAPADRLDKLREFWRRVEHGKMFDGPMANLFSPMRTMSAIMSGIPAFFTPNPLAFLGQKVQLGAESAGYYSVQPLRETLSDLVDFDVVNSGPTRLTVGAANVQTSEMRYFDSRDTPLDLRHVMASGALPPAFPAVRIDGELFWDGGIVSNTPVEAVFDDNPRSNAMVFAVHLWNPHGAEPQSIWEVTNRQKDIQYSSRAHSHIKRQRQIHKLRHVIQKLSLLVPDNADIDEDLAILRSYGCETKMHVVRLLAPQLDNEDHTKDVDFSPRGIRERWEAGYAHTSRMLEKAPWRAEADPLEGFILHEAMGGEIIDVAAA
ncbi:MAG: patatin-like phospholipase family protein [Sphingomonadaceae bacterium]